MVKAQCMVNTEMWDILPAWDSPWQTWTSLITYVFFSCQLFFFVVVVVVVVFLH